MRRRTLKSGITTFRTRKTERPSRDYKKLWSSSRDSDPALVGLAQAQQKLGKNEDARRDYEAYLKLEPNGPDAEKAKKALAQLGKAP